MGDGRGVGFGFYEDDDSLDVESRFRLELEDVVAELGAGIVGRPGPGGNVMGMPVPPVTPTTNPFSQPFSLLNASHSFSSSPTRTSSSFAFLSSAASLSFFFSRNRADAAVFRLRLSSAAPRGVAEALSSGDSGRGDSAAGAGTDTELLRVVRARLFVVGGAAGDAGLDARDCCCGGDCAGTDWAEDGIGCEGPGRKLEACIESS